MNKTKLQYLTAILLLAGSLSLGASEPASPKNSPEFERMKTLVGTWKGTADMGQGPTNMIIEYRLLAAGSVLEERIFPGTPNEMITMYFEKDGRLALTHYCILGNRPGMFLSASDSKSLKFELDAACGINPIKETHMNALTIRFEDPDTLTTFCRSMVDGKPVESHPTTLRRVK